MLRTTTSCVMSSPLSADGLEGLEPRSRAPRTSPRRVGADLEDAVVALRKELTELGVDHGPATIQWHLGRRGLKAVPSQATIWRVLVRRGFVMPEPRKRPKSSFRRFEATAPNELWQTDATDWVIATGTVKVLSFLDDHSRIALRVKARRRGDHRGHLGRVQRGQRRLGCATRSAQRQRAELLRTPPRLRGLLRDPATSDRRGGQDQPALPPQAASSSSPTRAATKARTRARVSVQLASS